MSHPEPRSTAATPAGFLQRSAATLIDSLLFSLLLLPPLWALYGPALLVPGSPVAEGWPNVLIGWVLPAVVVILFWRWKRGTPGKLLLDLHVVDARSGKAPGLGQSVVRYLGYYVSLLPCGLGFLWVLWDPRRQAWHDKLAGTLVVHRRRG